MTKINEIFHGEKELAEVEGQADIDWVRMDEEQLFNDPLYHPDHRRFRARRVLQHLNGDRR